MEDEEKRLKNELESELKASLIDAFKKHKILIANFPLNIKIEVLRVEEGNSLDRVSFNNKKLNVDLSLDHSSRFTARQLCPIQIFNNSVILPFVNLMKTDN